MKKCLYDELKLIIEDYKSSSDFLSLHNNITIMEFDYYIINKYSLFIVHDNYDFDMQAKMLDKLEYTLPSIKRIFAKPIIHLSEKDEILPVEKVRLINSKTITHIASHSELWSDVTERGIKPSKLLTNTYQDNYSIYENILFAKTVDCMLQYLRRNMRELKSLMTSCSTLEFNYLERVNHWDYFLAIGKLHTGYARNFGKYYNKSKDLYDRMSLINQALTTRLKRNVYRKNHNKTKGFKLHNSNILHMQIDYHRVYLLYKHFDNIKETKTDISKDDIVEFNKNYFSYLKLLTIFAIEHFNFTIDENIKIDFDNLSLKFNYLKWTLKLGLTKDKQSIYINISKDKVYKAIIVPYFITKRDYKADEIIIASPFTSIQESEYISVNDVDSFRRIERIIARGMVYSDTTFDTCYFCGEKLKLISNDNEHSEYLCSSCHTVIKENVCPIKGISYYTTSIYGYKIRDQIGEDTSSLLHYRNITNITKDGDFICPCCNKVHND